MNSSKPLIANVLCMDAQLNKITNDASIPDRTKMTAYQKTHEIFVDQFKPHIPVTHKLDIIQSTNKSDFESQMQFVIPGNNNFLTHAFFKVEISNLQTVSDSGDMVRFVRFPGHRILKRVCFYDNKKKLIDEYYSDHYNIHYDAELTQSEKKVWQLLVGDSDNETGLQAFKTEHDECVLTVPVLFWFRKLKTGYFMKADTFNYMTIDTAPLKDLISYFGDTNRGYQIPDLKIELVIRTMQFPQYFNDAYLTRSAVHIRTHSIKKYAINMVANNAVFLCPVANTGTKATESIHIRFVSNDDYNHSQTWANSQDVCDVALVSRDQSCGMQDKVGIIELSEMMQCDTIWFNKSTQKILDYMENREPSPEGNTISIRGNLLRKNNPSGYLNDNLNIACKLKSTNASFHGFVIIEVVHLELIRL